MGYLGIPQNRDDGKRALAAIEVSWAQAPFGKGSGENHWSRDHGI